MTVEIDTMSLNNACLLYDVTLKSSTPYRIYITSSVYKEGILNVVLEKLCRCLQKPNGSLITHSVEKSTENLMVRRIEAYFQLLTFRQGTS
jgi:hypothetical protein